MRDARYDDDGTLDEVVADCVTGFHLERMDKGSWWIGLEHRDGTITHISISSRSGRDAADEIERLREALTKISDGEAVNLSSNPLHWPSTVAFLALGGEIKDGQRVHIKGQE